MTKSKAWPSLAGIALVVTVMFVGSPVSSASSRAGTRFATGPHVSSVVLRSAMGPAMRGPVGAPAATCSTPGAGNYMADCNTSGNPVNETSIAYNGEMFVAGANDYNSWNGNADLGYYTSTDGKTWTDNAPLDLFPHGVLTAAGDPGLAIDTIGVVYYSGIYFDYNDCNVGGLELARRNPSNGVWSYYQIGPNTDGQFQDKPAIMQDERHVFVSWTRYGSCTGIGVASPIKVAVFDPGAASVPPIRVMGVPGSLYSQGSAMASDGSGGFWITWEEFSDPSDTNGEIRLAHWRRTAGWSAFKTISPPGFTDLPSPLPGFVFRDNSFPMIAAFGNRPKVVWTSYDTGAGRTYLWSNGTVTTVSDSGGDQFFPSVAADATGALAISWSQTKTSNASFDQYLSYGGVSKVSTASSFPNSDPFFGGAFIGDYSAMVVAGVTAHPIWTDVRGPTFFQNAMVYSP